MNDASLFEKLLTRVDAAGDIVWKPALRLGETSPIQYSDTTDAVGLTQQCNRPTTEISGCGEHTVDNCPPGPRVMERVDGSSAFARDVLLLTI